MITHMLKWCTIVVLLSVIGVLTLGATSFLVPKNNASGVLEGDITDVATTVVLEAGDGANFPSTYNYHITIDDEIMAVTNRSTDTLTVIRAQEGTAAVAHYDGADVRLNITAKALSDLNTAVNAIENGTVGLAKLDVDGDVDIDFDANTEEINIATSALDYAADSAIVTITDTPGAGTGATNNTYLLRLLHEANGDPQDHFLVCEDNNGDDMFSINSGGSLSVAGATGLSGTLTVGGATTLSSTLSVAGTSTLKGNTTIGDNTDGNDYTLTFDGNNANGILQWMEDEDSFYFQDWVGIGTSDAGGPLEVQVSTTGASRDLIIRNAGASGANQGTCLAWALQTGNPKAAIYFRNNSLSNGRGDILICNDIVDDTGVVTFGDAKITLPGNSTTVNFAGDIQVTGNDIKNSDGETTISMNADQNVTLANNLSFGNDKKIYFGASNVGTLSYNLSTDNVELKSAGPTTDILIDALDEITIMAEDGVVLIDADTDVDLTPGGSAFIDCGGFMELHHVDDAAMDSTNCSRTGVLVFNDDDSKVYVCTTAGSPATWSALN